MGLQTLKILVSYTNAADDVPNLPALCFLMVYNETTTDEWCRVE